MEECRKSVNDLVNEGATIEEAMFEQSNITDHMRSYSKINKYFSKDLLKLFYYYALNYELGDNNQKAELYEEILESVHPGMFRKLGTGTNRIAFQRGHFVFKIALDRRGIIDNISEFKRSKEATQYLALTYETNGLMVVAEYVDLMDKNDFTNNREAIMELLSELAKDYIIGDMGCTPKNYCNFGYRKRGAFKYPVILDYAYMHPRWTNEEAMICPNCGAEIGYNANYSGFRCSNPQCGIEYTYSDIKRRLDTSTDNLENLYMSNLATLDAPDLENITFALNDDEEEDSTDTNQAIPLPSFLQHGFSPLPGAPKLMNITEAALDAINDDSFDEDDDDDD